MKWQNAEEPGKSADPDGMQEVSGSIPLGSTIPYENLFRIKVGSHSSRAG
jgi:hypothetical protein